MKGLYFESLLADLCAHFFNIPVDQIDTAIIEAQSRICDFLDLDRSILWKITNDTSWKILLSHVHDTSKGFLPDDLFNPEVTFPWMMGLILQGEAVIIEDAEALPPEAEQDRHSFLRWRIKACFVAPLVSSERVIGALSFCNLREKSKWTESIVQKLQLVSQVFSNALTRKRAEERLEFQRLFEALVIDISTEFINLPSDQIDAHIENALRRICECLNVDLSTLWQWSESASHFMTLTHLHSPPEGPKRPKSINVQESFPYTLNKLLGGQVVIDFTDDLPPEAAADQKTLRLYGIQSHVAIPLSTGKGEMIGILSFDALSQKRAWSEPIVEKLCLVAQVLANALSRKHSDLQLRESRARLSMATEAAGVGLWIMETASDNIWITPGTRELFQFEEDEVITYACFDQKIDSADRARVQQAVQYAIQSGETLDIEFRIGLHDGGYRWIKSSGQKLAGVKGQADRLMGASLDISQRRNMEDQLRNQLEEIEGLKQQLEKENISLRKEIELQFVHEDILCRSQVMKKVLAQAEKVARTEATVLIHGETGTGKELLARAVHRMSERRGRPLVTVNCASLPPSLVENELFGREKGAYTGALTRMTGRFEMADRATLFLDEIGELPIDVQAKLLRVLEEGSFERLGSTKTIHVDVRIIAATNQDLARLVESGKFRKDLYYRLNVYPIHLPPLRERLEDVPVLVLAFAREYGERMGRRIDHIPRPCMDELQRYAWPGNVRELRNVIERALIECSSKTLVVHPPQGAVNEVSKKFDLHQAECNHILRALEQTGWRISGPGGSAEILGLKRTTLQSKMRKLGIERPQK